MIPTHLIGFDGNFYLADFGGAFIGGFVPPILEYEETDNIYCYRSDHYLEYGMADRSWTEYCGIGKLLAVKVSYVDGRKVPKLPLGWVLPYDWTDRHRYVTNTYDYGFHKTYQSVANISF